MRAIIPVIILCSMLAPFFACHKETEEDKVRKVVTEIQKSAEEKDIKMVLNAISKSYNDPQGNNHESIHRLLIAYFYQFPKISIYITKLDVSVKGASARAMFQAVLTSKGATESATAILPESLGIYAFDVSFGKESGDWKVVSAQWERIGDSEAYRPDNENTRPRP
jgi:hypothetical protein